ncbi:hemagglutinin repeat-containing protein [Aquitalea pelogenes]|uniref:hemagglutinin repeat-containing protein n=1 Tax=Aquitalea pelogenes TaxID=1293573 RepID=UPI0035B3E5B8
MNRQCYRLVFNTLRNLLMPVAELTGSYQRSASTRPGAGQAWPCCWAWRPLALALLLLSLPGAALAQILADPAAPAGQRPTILNTASGAVQINIQTPTAGGVSMNQYRQFDTTTPVTIFNNGRSASQTQSAGWVAGNPWLAGGSARVIVNQVNSANTSRLSGTMEIAGARADLIIANPSGLRIDGVTVLNANRSTFAAATPQLAGGVVQGFQTGNGILQINGAGLNDSGSDYTTILARAVQLNAGLWAQQLQLSTGQNQLDATGKLITTTTPVAGADGAAPAYSLDVAAIGGMYAGKITLLATEHGLGARNAGELVASQGDLQLQADGRLINTGRMLAQQGGSLHVQSQGLDNDGTLSASRNLHIANGPLSNSGLINAGRELVLNTSDIRNNSSGSISGQRVQIDADSLDNAGQLSQTGQQGLLLQANALHSSGAVGLPPKASTAPELPSTPDDGAATPPATGSTNAPGGDAPVYSQPTPAEVLADGTIRVAGLLDNSGSLLANGGIDLSLQQGLQNHGSMQLRTLQLFGPMLDNRQGRLYVDQAHIDTGAIHNQGGTLVARQDITLRTPTLNNQQGKLAAAGGLSLMTGQLDNRAGWLEAAGLLFNGGDIDNRQGGIFARDISASSGTVDNRGGLLAASQSLQLDTGGQTLWNADSGDTLGVLSGGRLALKTGDLFNLRDGRIQASTLDINSSTLRNQAGLIMGDTVTLQGDALDNQAGLIAAKTSLSLVAAQSLHNQGELHSLGDAAVQADTLQQQGGLTTASRNLAVQARQLGSTGQFVAGQDLTLNTRQDLTVQAAIQAGRNLVLSTTGKLDNQSSLRAGGSASIQADSISNASQADITASTLNLQATTSLDNQGLIDAGDASLLAGQAISNRGSGRIYADRLLLAAPQLDNTPLAGQAPVIAARQQLGIATDQLLNGENAQLISLGDMVIGGGFDDSGQINRPASLVDNQSASIEAGGNMQISADTVRNQRLRVGMSQQSSIDETVTMNLASWQRNGGNGGDLRNSANYRASQIYFVDPADIISNEQIITPDGKVLGRAVVKLGPQTSTFFFANGRGWGMTGERWRINIDQPQTQTIYYTLRQDSMVNPDQSPDGLDPFLLLHGPGGTGGAPYFSYQTDAVRYDAQYGSCSSNCVLLITPYQLTDPVHTIINRSQHPASESGNERYRTAHHTALDDVLTVDAGAAPTIRAGGNMLLQPGQLLDNQYGQISAADQLQIDGGTASQIINTAATLYRNHHFDVTSHTYAGGSFANPQPDIRETIGSVDASIQGKTSLIINADTVANLDQGRPGPSPIAPPVPGSEVARLSQTSNGTVQLEPGSNGIPGSVLTQPPTIQLPRSSLYRLLPDGPAPLLETDPALTNRQAWLGSDYLLAGLSPDPNTALKRLGDGYVEQQLINQQVSRLTGQSLLAGYSDGQAQFRALMDNGKTFAASHQLVPGVALTAAQMAQLTSDIVWLVSQTVTLPDGRSQQVLVPQVYVKLQQSDLAPSGAILAADRLQLQLKGDLTNQGSMAGRQLLSINADTINNLAGRLQGGDLAIHANTDLNNQGGRIQADHSLSLSAGRDLTSASTTYSQQHGSGGNTLQQTALDRMAGLYLGQGTGPMLLAAGRNLDLSGSQLSNQSSGSTVLSAGQDLTLGTTDTTQQRRITWNANNWSAQASTDQTGSRLSTQGDLTLQAGRNLAATAATLDSAQGQVQLQAGQDLTLASGQQTQQLEWQSHSSKKGWLSRSSSDDSYQGAQSWAKGSQINAGNGLTLQAGQDLNLQGSLLTSAQGQANLIAGRDINMEAGQNTDRYQQQSSSSDSKLFRSSQRADQSSVARTTLNPSELAAQQINIQAGRDLNLSASNLQAEQGLTASAQRDLNLTTQTTRETRSAAHQENSRGFSFSLLSGLQYGGNRGQDLGNFTATQQTGSTLSGQNVQLSAGHDATLQAATVLADQNLQVQAGRNVNILAATNTLETTHQASASSWSVGLVPGAAPRQTMFGTTSSKENGTQPSTTQSTSLLSANSGNLTVLAGADNQYTGTGQGNLLSQGANLQAKQTATLQGNAVTLDAITNQDNNQYHQETKSFTIGSQLSGTVGSVITSVYDAAQAARNTSNDRLQGALALKAGYDAYKLMNGGAAKALQDQAAANIKDSANNASRGNASAFGVSTTVGSNSSSQDSSSSTTTQRGTIVQADTLNITASDGNLSATGAKLQATDINLSASKDILLQAATNTAEVHNKNESSNASVGATVGFGQQNGISFQLGVGQSQGVANGSETTYDNTLVTASNQLNLHSGNDTTLFGAQLAGKTVNADVGGKLAITTLQDQSQYESHQSSSGFDISVCVPPICYGQFVSGSANLAAQDINHDYQSATGQSGIAAGSGGFNLNVAGNTSLTGAAITSQASAEHNTLTTGSLSYQDLDNHQRTDASATSIGISAGNGSTLLSNVMSNLAANALGK